MSRALILLGVPFALAAFAIIGPFRLDSIHGWSGLSFDVQPGWLPAFPTIDPNIGFTSFALGRRAALDLLSGKLPLWNPYEGLGAPLLGEMQSAALFPPTLLLALPHGQIMEQSLLQAVAGVGTYLFLRRFGLGTTAALAGGVLFELNGVFAWLRNAIYNPVAFLPWLYLLVESLFAAARSRAAWRERWPTVLRGALPASLALYAGFPEIVYLYCLPVFLWVAFRGVCLGWRRALSYVGDLALCACLTLLLAAPVLLAFLHYLAVANVGLHQGMGTQDGVLSPAALVMYLFPYLYGPIFFAPQEAIAGLWGGIGGYLGLMPALLAVAGLIAARRNPAVWVLAAWVVVALGASHGLPGVHAAFMHLPLTDMALYARYLNAGWLFGCTVLGAVFVEQLATAPRPAWRRAGMLSAAIVLALAAGALASAWPLLAEIWGAHRGQRLYVVVSLLTASALMAGFVLSLAATRARSALIALAGSEALLAFTVPFASGLRGVRTDWALVEFLRRAGLQRVAIASGTGLSPNYGSAFGIATINYDDLPVPARTAEYVLRALDPQADPIMFRPTARRVPPDQRREEFLQHLPGYLAAGTRYYLADAEFFSRPAQAVTGDAIPAVLPPDERLSLDLVADAPTLVQGLTLRVGTFGGASDGSLRARLCQAGRCSEGVAPLSPAADNQPLPIRLDASVPLLESAPYRLLVTHEGGRRDVALWSRLSAGGPVPELRLIPEGAPWPVLAARNTTVFEHPGARGYATAPDCRVQAQDRDHIVADCAQASRLLRLEVFMPGWTALVNGAPAEIAPAEATFQGVELPAGRSVVEFAFAPAFVRPAIALAAATLLGLLLSLRPARRQDRPTRPASNHR